LFLSEGESQKLFELSFQLKIECREVKYKQFRLMNPEKPIHNLDRTGIQVKAAVRRLSMGCENMVLKKFSGLSGVFHAKGV